MHSIHLCLFWIPKFKYDVRWGNNKQKKSDDEYKQEYSLKINKRNMELIKDTLFVDFGVEAKYSSETENLDMVLLTVELDDLSTLKFQLMLQ